MPNWCNNTLTLTHNDPAMMQRALKGFNAKAFMSEFLPIPEPLKITAGREGPDGSPEQVQLVAAEAANITIYGFKNWYDWCVATWGTKWDFGLDADEPATLNEDGALRVGFVSAWSPPLEGYFQLMDLGFNVLAYYHEPGEGFYGKVTNEGDFFYRIEGGANWIKENIPDDILNEMGVDEEMLEDE